MQIVKAHTARARGLAVPGAASRSGLRPWTGAAWRRTWLRNHRSPAAEPGKGGRGQREGRRGSGTGAESGIGGRDRGQEAGMGAGTGAL